MVRRRRGYSLVESLLVVAILGILASLAAGLLVQVSRYWSLTTARLSLQREARAALYVMGRELRQAQSASIVIDRYNTSQPFCSRISFQKTGQTTVRSFYQKGNQLIQLGGQPTVLSNSLAYFAVTFPRSDDMTIVSLSMTLQKSIYEGRTKALHMASEKAQVMN